MAQFSTINQSRRRPDKHGAHSSLAPRLAASTQASLRYIVMGWQPTASGTADSRRVRSNQRSNSVVVAFILLGAVQLDPRRRKEACVRCSIERERDHASKPACFLRFGRSHHCGMARGKNTMRPCVEECTNDTVPRFAQQPSPPTTAVPRAKYCTLRHHVYPAGSL